MRQLALHLRDIDRSRRVPIQGMWLATAKFTEYGNLLVGERRHRVAAQGVIIPTYSLSVEQRHKAGPFRKRALNSEQKISR